jgi:S-adenosylmethionine:tRNA-ribosyltransferase-isomerase (queuine synthetase)
MNKRVLAGVVLAAAFAGLGTILAAYRYAVEK